MKCPKCQYENEHGALVCNLCGELLVKPSAESESSGAKTTESPPSPAGAPIEMEKVAVPGWSKASPLAGGGPLRYGLTCFPLDPVVLDREHPVGIGRSKNNEMVLPVGMVSRRHAEVFFDGDAFAVRDLGSSNGTFVNGEKVETESLSDGDEIRIGPYNLTFKAFRGDLDQMADSSGVEKTQNFTQRQIMEKSSTFSGSIGEMRMDEVFQLIEFNRKTGTLEVESGGKRGVFPFREGQILDARFHKSTGEVSVARVLSLPSGTFFFRAGDSGQEQKIEQGTSQLVLNAMRRLDEMK